MNFYLITYDVPDDKPRTKLADLLQDYGSRVQYSVFEAWLKARQFAELRDRVAALMGDHRGEVRFYRLCALCQQNVSIVGDGDLPTPPGIVII